MLILCLSYFITTERTESEIKIQSKIGYKPSPGTSGLPSTKLHKNFEGILSIYGRNRIVPWYFFYILI